MNEKVLFVDDEVNALLGYQRQFRKDFTVHIATGGEAALNILAQHGPFAVIVSDMRMPQMSGIEFLNKALIAAPNSVRMMLTGNADQETAIEAVNEGRIFRFLSKPCPPEMLLTALQAGTKQYRLIMAETELLDKTLLGSVNVFTEILSIVDPVAFDHARKLRKQAQEVADTLKYQPKWQLELAALLSSIGRMTLPSELTTKSHCNEPLSDTEKEVLERVPEIGRNLLAKIPRMGPVAEIIYYQSKHYCGAGFPNDAIAGENIPVGARILKILSDLLAIEEQSTPRYLALRLMTTRKGLYDSALLGAINAHYNPPLPNTVLKARGSEGQARPASSVATGTAKPPVETEKEMATLNIGLDDLLEGDLLTASIMAQDGALLLTAGTVVTPIALETLKNIARLKGVREPIQVATSGGG